MSEKYFKDVGHGIRTVWLSAPAIASFFTKLKRVTRFYRQFCIYKAQTNKYQEEQIRTTLDSKARELKASPLSIDLQVEVQQLRSKLQQFETQKLEGQKVRS